MLTPLRRIRLEKGLHQWELADKIGIYPQELSTYETGRRRCASHIRRKIAEVLETSTEELFPEETKGER